MDEYTTSIKAALNGNEPAIAGEQAVEIFD
jgi:hypothetical protein